MIDLVIDQLLRALRDPVPTSACATTPSSWGRACGSTARSWAADDEVREVLKHGTLTVGFIGLAETPEGADRRSTTARAQKAQNLGLEIIGHMRDCADRELARRAA